MSRFLMTGGIVLSLALGLGLASGSAFAEDDWQRDHPRRAEVNGRLANQDARIHQERREGEINGAQAASLHAQDHAIRMQERADASTQDGHITRAQQAQLNREENGVSREIGQ